MVMYLETKQVKIFPLMNGSYSDYRSGNESQAVVEFAPYQKIPTEKKKVDARNATIEKGMSVSFVRVE